MENIWAPWAPVTPVKPSLRRPSRGDENQQKSDGSDTSISVTLDSEEILVVDFNEKKWVENEGNSCSISAASEKANSVSQGKSCKMNFPS